MTFLEWANSRVGSRLSCKVIENLTCRPLKNDKYCIECYEKEKDEERQEKSKEE